MANRRTFLKAAVAAPVAVPVAAKDAAIKMGLGNASDVVGGFVSSNEALSGPGYEDELDWLKRRLSEVLAEDVSGHRDDLRLQGVRRLDRDLAALRSVSPAWAEMVQIERTIERSRLRAIRPGHTCLVHLEWVGGHCHLSWIKADYLEWPPVADLEALAAQYPNGAGDAIAAIRSDLRALERFHDPSS